MVQLQCLLKLLNLTPVFPVYQVTRNHAHFFANQRRLANLPQTECPSFPSARPPLPCTSVWQPVPAVVTSRCGLSNSSANALAEAPGPAVAAQELSALSGLMGRKKKGKRHCRIGVTLLGLLKLGRSKVESLQMLVSLSADSVTLISLLSPFAPPPLFFSLKF